jgi:predicted transposase YdaD
VHLDQLNSLVEDKDMLAENLENLVKKERLQGEQAGIQRGRLEGRQEGRLEGRRETLVALIELKFGPLPGWAAQRINHAESDQLDTWTKGILTAESLEVLLGKH